MGMKGMNEWMDWEIKNHKKTHKKWCDNSTNGPPLQITQLKVWHDQWPRYKKGKIVMEWCTFPVKQTMHNSVVTYTSTQCEYVWTVLCGIYWLCVMLWWQKKERHKAWMLWLAYGGIFVSLSSFYSSFVLKNLLNRTGWEVMDIQRTRTAPETGTGRQFDTTQRHFITAVADKTQSFSPVCF